MNAVGLPRTYDTVSDTKNFFQKLQSDPSLLTKVIANIPTSTFYRFFSNYGTEIGETIEEVAGKKFTDLIPKKVVEEKITKGGRKLTLIKPNPIYKDYNTANGKKPSNYDWLYVTPTGEYKCLEIKVVRAVSGKESQADKLTELPAPLEERALSYEESKTEWSGGKFQQTKAEMFDVLLGVAIYTDQIDYYLIPTDDIKSGKLKIGNQHAGAILEDGITKEGQIFLKDIPSSYIIFSCHSEAELLTKDTLTNYIK